MESTDRHVRRRYGRPHRGPRQLLGLRLAVLAIALTLLAGCASSIKVRDLLSDPGRYNGRTVQVHGVVTKGWPLMNGAYELSDNTGSILVIIDDPRAPRDGTSLKVSGTFRSSYQWDGDNVAAILKSR